MAVFRASDFKGAFYGKEQEYLAPNEATDAYNFRPGAGGIRPIQLARETSATFAAAVASIYHYRNGADDYLGWTERVRVQRGPIAEDPYKRIYWSTESVDDEPLRYLKSDDVGALPELDPAGASELGIPAPENAPTAQPVGGTDDFADVETRFYVYTYVDDLGQEGPPSPASAEVEVSARGLVTVSLPPPDDPRFTRAYLYRTNTGSVDTIFQFVAEVVPGDTANFGYIDDPDTRIGTTYEQGSGPLDIADYQFAYRWEREQDLGGGNFSYSDATMLSPFTLHRLYYGNDKVEFEEVQPRTNADAMAQGATHVSVWVSKGEGATRDTPASQFGDWTLVYRDEMDNSTSKLLRLFRPDLYYAGGPYESIERTAVTNSTSQGVGTYQDSLDGSQLGEELSSQDNDPPPVGLKGLTLAPSGYFVAYKDRTLYFSKQGLAHAWPVGLRQDIAHEITGIESYANGVFVGTVDDPYAVTGATPESAQAARLDYNEPCIGQETIVSTGGTVYYASPNGLIQATTASAENLTRKYGLYQPDGWRDRLQVGGSYGEGYKARYPARAVLWEDNYLFASAGLAYELEFFNLRDPNLGCVRYGTPAGVFNTGPVQPGPIGPLLRNRGGGVFFAKATVATPVYEFAPDGPDNDGSRTMMAMWRSRAYLTRQRTNFAVARVRGYARNPLALPPFQFIINSDRERHPDYPYVSPLTIHTFSSNGYSVEAPLDEQIRLPAGYLEDYWYVTLLCKAVIVGAEMATSVQELVKGGR